MEPIEIFEGDRFKLTCSVSIYVPERINDEAMKFFFYKDNIKLDMNNETTKSTSDNDNIKQTRAETYITVVNLEQNGNYFCEAQTASLRHNLIKESQRLVVQAKGKHYTPHL